MCRRCRRHYYIHTHSSPLSLMQPSFSQLSHSLVACNSLWITTSHVSRNPVGLSPLCLSLSLYIAVVYIPYIYIWKGWNVRRADVRLYSVSPAGPSPPVGYVTSTRMHAAVNPYECKSRHKVSGRHFFIPFFTYLYIHYMYISIEKYIYITHLE